VAAAARRRAGGGERRDQRHEGQVAANGWIAWRHFGQRLAFGIAPHVSQQHREFQPATAPLGGRGERLQPG
jgi:hypothetical protein